ncbi:hypothetical protein GPALN_012737 [Globodera pallida]|nr:hypothetical protein GPALN_012737 [Globodera pallida]
MIYSTVFRNWFFSTISKRAASSIREGHVEYFRELNRLSSAGAWDPLNMRPKIFSTRSEKAAANKIWAKMLPDDAGWFDRRPGGKFLKMFVQIPLILGSLLMIPVVYEKIVPEKHRCKIKYGKNDEH